MPKNSKGLGAVPIIVLIAAVGILLFLFISNTFDFKNRLFSNLFLKPPSHAAITQTIKVWMLEYHPVGDYFHVTGDNLIFTQNTLLPAMNEASKYHGYSTPSTQASLNYTLASTDAHVENNPPPYISGTTSYDYGVLFSKYDLCNYAKTNDIKAVILWADGSGPYAGGMWESAITGNKGIPTNGAQLPYCPNKTIVVYGLNYTRGLPEALESYGHHLERVFGQFRPEYGAWADKDSCGTDHNPPNARFEYDRSNTADFQSDCRNWKADGTGQKEALNCTVWNCTGDGWLVWWMQNMPGLDNNLYSPNGVKIPNWWVYIADPDNCYNNALSCSNFASPTPTLTPTPTSTPAAASLTISNIHSTTSPDSATITWTTNIPSTSRVSYGTTTSLESSTPEDTSLVTSHQVILTNLTKQIKYYFKVHSRNSAGLETSSTIQQLRTKNR